MKKQIPALLLCLSLISLAFGQSAVVITENANLRGTPSERGRVVETLSHYTSLEIIQQRGAWFLVQAPDVVGWIHGNTIRLDSKAETAPVYVTPKPNTRTNTRTNSESRTYIRGPRGGCYYLSGTGRKVYVERSLCN